MCGVSAIFAFHPSAPPVSRSELRRIADAMRRRGPDASGEWHSRDDRVSIGHRRLAIIDPSPRADQPMVSADERVVVSFNGEIYNHHALRKALERRGHVFHSRCDTEVILRLYEDKGEAMLEDLRGMFALVVWDARLQTLLLARDAYGIKPLYYANDGWSVRVASQVKALLAGGGVSRLPDPAGHAGFFLLGSVPEPYTCYQEIRAVPAGSLIRVDRRGPSPARVWTSIPRIYREAAAESVPMQLDEARDVTHRAVADSVRHHLVSDVPVGAFLSSGIDSNAVVRLAAEVAREPIETLTLAFPEFTGESSDESRIAQRTAAALGTRHTTYRVSESEFRGCLDEILDAMDQPTIDGMNTWMISKAASDLGLKACLSGLGGDELFGGYPSFRDIPRWVRAMRVPSAVPLTGSVWRLAAGALEPLLPGSNPKATGFATYAGSYPGAYLLRRGLFMPWELDGILGREAAREGLRRLRPLRHIGEALLPQPGDAFARVACMESSLYMRNQLLRDADWAGMAHSLEIRVPLVDTTLLGTIARIAAGRRFPMSKELLVASTGTALERDIATRRKTGFMIPIETWLADLQSSLDSWRAVPALARAGCHWARRLAYAVHHQSLA